MPELPEVETIKRGLEGLIIGNQIARVSFDWPKGFPNAKTDVDEFLIGARIQTVNRRGKALIMALDTDYSLVIHLKMTGQLVYVQQAAQSKELQAVSNGKAAQAQSSPLKAHRSVDEVRFGAGHPNDSLIGELPDKSTRVTFTFSDDAHLFFNDQRKFGWVRLMPTVEVPNLDFFKKLGPEPLSATFTKKDFRSRLERRKNAPIKAALLDQTVIAGVGNIYADESLWAARIHPETRVSEISDAKLNKLYDELRSVMHLSIEKGGSSDKNYVDVAGRKGSYLNFANVFRREGQPCPRHPDTLIQKTRVAGRGTHTCPKCQNHR